MAEKKYFEESVINEKIKAICNKYWIAYNRCAASGFSKDIATITDMPAADVAEVKHSEWKIAIGYDIDKKVQCQNCYLMTFEPTKYCPHCGTRMDGDEK